MSSGKGVGTGLSEGMETGGQVREKAQAGIVGSQRSKGSQGRTVRALHCPHPGVCSSSVGWLKPTLTTILLKATSSLQRPKAPRPAPRPHWPSKAALWGGPASSSAAPPPIPPAPSAPLSKPTPVLVSSPLST